MDMSTFYTLLLFVTLNFAFFTFSCVVSYKRYIKGILGILKVVCCHFVCRHVKRDLFQFQTVSVHVMKT